MKEVYLELVALHKLFIRNFDFRLHIGTTYALDLRKL